MAVTQDDIEKLHTRISNVSSEKNRVVWTILGLIVAILIVAIPSVVAHVKADALQGAAIKTAVEKLTEESETIDEHGVEIRSFDKFVIEQRAFNKSTDRRLNDIQKTLERIEKRSP